MNEIMSEPAGTDNFRVWWQAQTAAPYQLEMAAKQEPNVEGRGAHEPPMLPGR